MKLDKKDELKRIERNVVIGTIISVVPIALDKLGLDTGALSALLGTTTLYKSYSDFSNNSKLETKNPYWLIWKWEQLTKDRIE